MVSDDFIDRSRIPNIAKDHLILFFRFLGAGQVKFNDSYATRP